MQVVDLIFDGISSLDNEANVFKNPTILITEGIPGAIIAPWCSYSKRCDKRN